MGIMNKAMIAGYRMGKLCVCESCLTEEELNNLKLDNLITFSNLEENDICFCDRCKKKISEL